MELARWLRKFNTFGQVFSMKDLLMLADEMIAGRILDKNPIWFSEHWVKDGDPVVLIETDVENEWEQWARERSEQAALLDKAVAGDTEAALRYCRMMAHNEIHTGAMG